MSISFEYLPFYYNAVCSKNLTIPVIVQSYTSELTVYFSSGVLATVRVPKSQSLGGDYTL